ncbi:hypothetical protein [Saccharomonospora sp.]|uniref:hypothetical protein n=1 Tax=Saccharomonospora sp. TaxID=33913 RepID=UPI002634D2B7|nr:hypothetical protein [Saccharomonospora sp.]
MAIDRFTVACAAMASARAHQERALSQADRRLAAPTGEFGSELTTLSWKRRRINTVADAVLVARAVRAHPAAVEARRALEVVRTEESARVRAAEVALSAATSHLRSYGAIGNQIVDGTPPHRAVRSIS